MNFDLCHILRELCQYRVYWHSGAFDIIQLHATIADKRMPFAWPLPGSSQRKLSSLPGEHVYIDNHANVYAYIIIARHCLGGFYVI